MSKYKTTKKAMKEKWGSKLFSLPDGSMQYFGWACPSPTAYSERGELGWACDYYEFDDFCICEGYAPVGKEIMTYEEFEPYRKARDVIAKGDYEKKAEKYKELLRDFVGSVKAKMERRTA